MLSSSTHLVFREKQFCLFRLHAFTSLIGCLWSTAWLSCEISILQHLKSHVGFQFWKWFNFGDISCQVFFLWIAATLQFLYNCRINSLSLLESWSLQRLFWNQSNFSSSKIVLPWHDNRKFWSVGSSRNSRFYLSDWWFSSSLRLLISVQRFWMVCRTLVSWLMECGNKSCLLLSKWIVV